MTETIITAAVIGIPAFFTVLFIAMLVGDEFKKEEQK